MFYIRKISIDPKTVTVSAALLMFSCFLKLILYSWSSLFWVLATRTAYNIQKGITHSKASISVTHLGLCTHHGKCSQRQCGEPALHHEVQESSSQAPQGVECDKNGRHQSIELTSHTVQRTTNFYSTKNSPSKYAPLNILRTVKPKHIWYETFYINF